MKTELYRSGDVGKYTIGAKFRGVWVIVEIKPDAEDSGEMPSGPGFLRVELLQPKAEPLQPGYLIMQECNEEKKLKKYIYILTSDCNKYNIGGAVARLDLSNFIVTDKIFRKDAQEIYLEVPDDILTNLGIPFAALSKIIKAYASNFQDQSFKDLASGINEKLEIFFQHGYYNRIYELYSYLSNLSAEGDSSDIADSVRIKLIELNNSLDIAPAFQRYATSNVSKYEVGGDFRGNTIKMVESSVGSDSGYILVELTTKKYSVSSSDEARRNHLHSSLFNRSETGGSMVTTCYVVPSSSSE